jgi:16S rRNA (guanine527-N7)-methyltransferase
MAIARPDWRLVLAEPRGKRLRFIEEAVDLLGLENVEVYPHKVADGFELPIGSMVARDFGPCGAIMAIAAKILPPGGALALMKGGAVERELEEAKSLPQWREFEGLQISGYSLGAGWPARRLVSMVRRGRPAPPRRESKIREIASSMNPAYKAWAKILSGPGSRKAGLAIVSGRKSVPETLARHPGEVLALLAKKAKDYEGLSLPESLEVCHLRSELFPALDLFGTGPPLLVVKAVEPPPWNPGEAFSGVRLMIPFQDPANVGAVIRTAAAMGVEVVLLKEAANPYHPKALRASGPAVFQARLQSGPSLRGLAAQEGFYALSPDGLDIGGFSPPPGLHLAMGLEGKGLGDDWPKERRLSIPMMEGVESLHAAAAAAIAMALLRFRGRSGGAGRPRAG